MVTSTVPPGARSTSPCGPSAGLPALSLVGGPPPGPHSSAPGGAPAPGAGNPPNRCCDTGRTIYTDPVSGQTICSCQYDMLNYQRLAAAGGVPLGVYPEGMSAYLSGIAADQPPFYANPVSELRQEKSEELGIYEGLTLSQNREQKAKKKS